MARPRAVKLTEVPPKLGIDLSPEQREQLLAYLRLLQQVETRPTNLTAVRVRMRWSPGHLLDSLNSILPVRSGDRWLMWAVGARDAGGIYSGHQCWPGKPSRCWTATARRPPS